MIELRHGFDAADRPRAARLFWDAFDDKLKPCLGPQPKAERYLAAALRPQFCFSAYERGTLLGLAGFKTWSGGLVGGNLRDLARSYGWHGAVWRAGVLSLFDSPTPPGELRLDGLCVDRAARGQGVGSMLLRTVLAHAMDHGFEELRLDVVAQNRRARALYARHGFEVTQTRRLRVQRWLMGVERVDTMRRALSS